MYPEPQSMYLILQRPSQDPYFNIAAEEYFFRKFDRAAFSVWQNREALVVGKHQNAYREINLSWLRSQNIPVIRRITGGGTVYHGPGNINFSFIFEGDPDNLIDFRSFTGPVIRFLREMGVPAEFRAKSNIEAAGRKISGNSAHLFRKKILYHGTLLFNADLERLGLALRKTRNGYTDRAVDSVPARVGNISSFTGEKMTDEEFREAFRKFMLNNYHGSRLYEADDTDKSAISQLVREKYSDPQWNFGYSPRYNFNSQFTFRGIQYQITIQVERGIIRQVDVQSRSSHDPVKNLLTGILEGKSHLWDAVSDGLLKSRDLSIKEKELNQLMNKLF